MGSGICAALALLPVAAHASAADLYYERAVASAAGARCHLFNPELAAALAAAEAQARGAALRSGVSEEQVDATGRRARSKVAAVSCNSSDIATVAERVRQGFAGYARLQKMIYPGEVHDWTADRARSSAGSVWSLSQTQNFGADQLVFGLAAAGDASQLVTVVQFSDHANPYTVRLVMRDPGRTARPFLDKRQADAKGVLPLPARLPPRAATRSFLADARFTPDGMIAPKDGPAALGYHFPAAAIEALGQLDPRESVAIEFVFSGAGRDVIRTAWIEVGDFAAGRAFLNIAQR